MAKIVPNILIIILLIFYNTYSLAFVVPPPPRLQDPHDTREIGEYYEQELLDELPKPKKALKDYGYDHSQAEAYFSNQLDYSIDILD